MVIQKLKAPLRSCTNWRPIKVDLFFISVIGKYLEARSVKAARATLGLWRNVLLLSYPIVSTETSIAQLHQVRQSKSRGLKQLWLRGPWSSQKRIFFLFRPHFYGKKQCFSTDRSRPTLRSPQPTLGHQNPFFLILFRGSSPATKNF